MKFFVTLTILLAVSYADAKPTTGFRTCTFSYIFAKDGSAGYRLTGLPNGGKPQILVETDTTAHHSEDAYEEGTANLCQLKAIGICSSITAIENGRARPIPVSQCQKLNFYTGVQK